MFVDAPYEKEVNPKLLLETVYNLMTSDFVQH